MNQFILVGQLLSKPQPVKGYEKVNYMIKVDEEETHKNKKGQYNHNCYEVLLNKAFDNACIKNMTKNTYIAVRGHFSTKNGKVILNADKIVFANDLGDFE